MTTSLLRRRARRPELGPRLEALAEALEAGGDRLDPEAVAAARELQQRAGERLRFGSSRTVVALAGSTGSGKSSLFNAIAGIDVAEVGVRRPTTSTATACVWGADGAEPLLDWLEVPTRHRVARESALEDVDESLHGLVLLDLPDHDSHAVAHRLEVDRLVGVVDLLVWVVDPQKYADDALHSGYLRRLAGHGAVVLVVLNQVDRLPEVAAEDLRRDLRRLLDEDGLPSARLLLASARRGDGVAELRRVLADVVQQQVAATERLAADLDAVVARLRQGVAPSEPDPARLAASDHLVEALAGAAGVPAVVDAVGRDYRRQAVASTGWPVTRWVGRLRPSPLRRLRLGLGEADAAHLSRTSLPATTPAQRARVELAARQVTDDAGAGLPQPWADAVHEAAAPLTATGSQDVADALDQAVARVDLEQHRPRWWGLFGALQVLGVLLLLAGLLWLVGLAVLAWLQLPEPPVVELEVGALRVPLPTALLLGGLLLGVLTAVVGRRLAVIGARRRRRRVRRRLEDAVRGVAQERVVEPVAEVVARHRRTREALARAA